METLRSNKAIAPIFKSAESCGILNSSFLRSGDAYQSFLKNKASCLLKNNKTKKDQLIKISASLIGYAYDQCGCLGSVDFAIDLVKEISKQLK